MVTRNYRIWDPPVYPSFVKTQRARFLHYSLIVSTLGAVLIAIPNYDSAAYFVVGILAALALYGIVGIRLNQVGRYDIAGWLLILLVAAAINANLIDGAGLHDPAIAALPLLILLFAVLFNRIWIFFAAGLTILSVFTVYFLNLAGVIDPGYEPTLARAAIISVLMAATSLVLWLFAGSWIKTVEFLRESYDRTLEGWVKALEFKDPATSGHVREVVDLTERLAVKLGCTEDEVLHIRRGALLHDIGKIGIPDRILSKNGPLSEDEWNVMREHPSLAREFLSGIPFLASAMTIPYSHHERWNGEGYPEGLQGEAIPLAARIFAVVDVWHALGEDRPYRRAWTRAEIADYIRSNAGSLFDPVVVHYFMEIIEA
jgi:HD-GYP domain-containing protein (c-di-GMP phosphodiesterase class II)